MRHILKSIILTVAVVYIVYTLVPTINLGTDPRNIAFIIGGLWLISQIVNPIFSLVLLPLNLITFGLVSFILNIAFVYVLIRLLPEFSVEAYNFPGANIEGIILPAISFSEIATIILVALIITIIQKIFHIIFQ